MPWLSEGDSAAIVKQIVRMAVHIGAMDIAEQYMLKCDSGGKEDLILKLQVMFKAAKPGAAPVLSPLVICRHLARS